MKRRGAWQPTGPCWFSVDLSLDQQNPTQHGPSPASLTDTCCFQSSLQIPRSLITASVHVHILIPGIDPFDRSRLPRPLNYIMLGKNEAKIRISAPFLHFILRVEMMDPENASLRCLTEKFCSFWAACINNNNLTRRLMFADSHSTPLHDQDQLSLIMILPKM